MTNQGTETSSESHTAFFRQGSWLVMATGLSGALMLGTQMIAAKLMEPEEWGVWFTLLRVYLLFGIPSLGLQTVFAQQAAAAVTPDKQAFLAATVRAVHRGSHEKGSPFRLSARYCPKLAVASPPSSQRWPYLDPIFDEAS